MGGGVGMWEWEEAEPAEVSTRYIHLRGLDKT
jgi:hypothetical protein